MRKHVVLKKRKTVGELRKRKAVPRESLESLFHYSAVKGESLLTAGGL